MVRKEDGSNIVRNRVHLRATSEEIHNRYGGFDLVENDGGNIVVPEGSTSSGN